MLLAGIVLLFIVAEVLVRFGIGPASRIEGRIERENRAALSMKKGVGETRTMLLIGNSLLQAGVDFPAYQKHLAPEVNASRFVVEQTDFLDWYYFLRKMYHAGGKPDFVVLNLTATQLANDQIRGEYFAYRMLSTGDVLSAARAAHLSATQTFSLLLGNLSAFYGTRSETRKFVLAKLIPGMNDLVAALVPSGAAAPLEREFAVKRLSERLEALDQLVREHGGKFILVEPASRNVTNLEYMAEAGRRTGVPVLEPMHPGSLSDADFLDGFHLTPEGATRYTSALGPLMRQTLAVRGRK